MPKQLIIESYGTPDTTVVYIDGEEVKDIVDITFEAKADDYAAKINIGYALYDHADISLAPCAVAKLNEMAVRTVKGVNKDETTNKTTKETVEEDGEETAREGRDED